MGKSTFEFLPVLFPTDRHNYIGAESGCGPASFELGRQSRCLECPFKKCIIGMPVKDRISLLNQIKNKREGG